MALLAAFGIITILWLGGQLLMLSVVLWHRCWSPRARGQVYFRRKQSVAWLACVRERGILK